MELIKQDGKMDDLKLAAKNIRIELKNKYPNVKFSIRTEYRGGATINISWSESIERKQIYEITDKYKRGYFDLMTDCYETVNTEFNKNYGNATFIFLYKN